MPDQNNITVENVTSERATLRWSAFFQGSYAAIALLGVVLTIAFTVNNRLTAVEFLCTHQIGEDRVGKLEFQAQNSIADRAQLHTLVDQQNHDLTTIGDRLARIETKLDTALDRQSATH